MAGPGDATIEDKTMTTGHTFQLDVTYGVFGGITSGCSCGWRKRIKGQEHAGVEWQKHLKEAGVDREHYLDIHKRPDGKYWMSCGPYWEFELNDTTMKQGLQAWGEHKRRTGNNCNDW
jgi:hypothetical protein